MEWLRLTANSVMVLPALLLALTTTIVIIAERKTSLADRSLALFFITGTGFLLALFLEFSAFDPIKAPFALCQFILLLASLTALSRFAYHPGQLPRSRAATLVPRLYIAALLVVAPMAVFSFFLWRATEQEPVALIQLMTLIVLVAFVGVMFVLLHQAVRRSGPAGRGGWRGLVWPQGASARTFRDLALALCIPVVLAAATILRDALFLRPRFFYLFLSIGLSLFVLALAVVYHRTASSTMRRLGQWTSGILMLILGVIAVVGSSSEAAISTTYTDTRIRELEQVRLFLTDHGDMLDNAAIPPAMAYVAVLQPVMRVIFARDPGLPPAIFTPLKPISRWSIEERAHHLQRSNPTLDLDQARAIAHREAQLREAAQLRGARGGSLTQYQAYRFWQNGKMYEVGFSYQYYRYHLHQRLAPYTWAMAGATVLAAGIAIFVRFLHPQRGSDASYRGLGKRGSGS